MNETLSVQIQGNIYATLQKQTPTDTIVDQFVQPLAINMSNGGLGVNVANQVFGGQFTVPANSATIYDLNAFGGELDNVGNPYNIKTVKTLFVQNAGTLLSNLNVSGAAAGPNGWTVAFTGTHALLGASGYMLLTNPGYFGMTVTPPNTLLAISNPNAWDMTYNILVIGATGTN